MLVTVLGCQITPPQYLAPLTLRLLVISSRKNLLYFIDTMAAWVSLPPKWKLQDVQAALNVIVVLLSTLGVFTFARFCWQSSATNIVRNQAIQLSSLLSINTLGQAFDILLLLRSRIFNHRKIFVQSVIVLSLSTTALLSGPTARYSTQNTYTIVPKQITGLLANRRMYNVINDIVQWNTIITSLDQAGFPYNQILDYLPDSNTLDPWVYKPEEWNNSWAMDCRYTYLTPITLYDTGNCSSNSTIYSEIPGLDDIIPANKYGANVQYDYGYYWEGDSNMNKDTLMAMIGWKYNNNDNTTNITYDMSITLASVHLHEHPRQMNDSSFCIFGRGNVTSASYTRIECDLRRLIRNSNVNYTAFPDTNDYTGYVAIGLTDFHRAQLPLESISNITITVPTPQDLIRFYQAYLISKDTFIPDPVSRVLSFRVQIVQLSVVFLVITILLVILVLLGILTYGFSMLRYSSTLGEMPQSTLDWILKSIQARHLQLGDPQLGDPQSDNPQSDNRIPSNKAFRRHSIASRMTDIYASSKRTWKRAEFENARYGAVQIQEQDLWEGRLLQQPHGRAEYCSDAATVPCVQGPVPQVIPRKPVGSIVPYVQEPVRQVIPRKPVGSIVPYVQGPVRQVIPREPVGSIDATEVPMLMMDFPENQNSFF
jgi:hypothetical protein